MKAVRINVKAISLILIPIMVLMSCSVGFAANTETVVSIKTPEESAQTRNNIDRTFTADTAEGKELTAVEIVSIPQKNKVVNKREKPETPEGIVLSLVYSDGSSLTEAIRREDNKYYAGEEEVIFYYPVADVVEYGYLTAELGLKNGEIKLNYEYYSPKPGEVLNPNLNVIPLKTVFIFISSIIDLVKECIFIPIVIFVGYMVLGTCLNKVDILR